MRQRMIDLVHREQDRICDALQAIDGGAPREDVWTREGGGEAAAECSAKERCSRRPVSTSRRARNPAARSRTGHGRRAGFWTTTRPLDFFATGLSLCFTRGTQWRPPFMPTTATSNEATPEPNLVVWRRCRPDPKLPLRKDATHFHATHKAVCDAHDVADYARFKTWCDDYFPSATEVSDEGRWPLLRRRERRVEGRMLRVRRSVCWRFLPPTFNPERRKDMPLPTNSGLQQLRRGRYGVQPRLRPWHDLWAEHQRTGGEHPDVLPLTARWGMLTRLKTVRPKRPCSTSSNAARVGVSHAGPERGSPRAGTSPAPAGQSCLADEGHVVVVGADCLA